MNVPNDLIAVFKKGWIVKYLCLCVMSILAVSHSAFGASFDCNKAASVMEKMICSNSELSQLDEKMAAAYKHALANANNSAIIKARQRDWIKSVRNQCQDAACIAQAYSRRFEQLSQLSANVDNAPDQANSGHYIVIPKTGHPVPVKNSDVKQSPVQLVGFIEFGHDQAGGKYDFVSGNKRYTLRYVGDLSDEIQGQLSKLDESSAKVTVKGVLRTWKGGGYDFDDATPVTIFQ